MDIDKSFQSGYKQIQDLLKEIKPDITEFDLRLVKIMCKSLVSNVILDIGNNTTSLTNTIKID